MVVNISTTRSSTRLAIDHLAPPSVLHGRELLLRLHASRIALGRVCASSVSFSHSHTLQCLSVDFAITALSLRTTVRFLKTLHPHTLDSLSRQHSISHVNLVSTWEILKSNPLFFSITGIRLVRQCRCRGYVKILPASACSAVNAICRDPQKFA